MKKNNVLFFLMSLVVSLTMFIFTSCSSDDPDPDNGKTVDPGTKVDDPEGTIFLSMRNSDSGDTWLDGFHIKNENFEGAYFVSLGPVKGLGNVSYIPLKGWSNRVAVVEGNGYVAYYNGTFYRLYVVSEIVGTTGGVIGAEIKYQKPFKGSDETIGLEEKSLSFSDQGGSQSLVFTNDKFVDFTCETDKSWCHVTPSSTTEFPFLKNAVTINVDPSETTQTDNAMITLTTAFGKKTTIQITRQGSKPFLKVENDETGVSKYEQTVMIGFTTNSNSEIGVQNSNNWLQITVEDNTAKMRNKAQQIKYIGSEKAEAIQKASSATSYFLSVHVTEHTGVFARVGEIKLSTKDKKLSTTFKIVQEGANGFCTDAKHPHAIDLGTGVKFACCNVGAFNPWEYGGYYAWGEVKQKTYYDSSSYLYYDGSYRNIGDDIAGTSYDVAHVLWKGSWKMPSQSQLEALRSQCSSVWASMNGNKGSRFTGRNGMYIFLPAAGYRWNDDAHYVGDHGLYWSSTQSPDYSYDAYDLYFGSGYVSTYNDRRYYGKSVRPVIE